MNDVRNQSYLELQLATIHIDTIQTNNQFSPLEMLFFCHGFLRSADDSRRGPTWQVGMTWLLQRLFKKKLTEGDGTIDFNQRIECRDNLYSAYKSKRRVWTVAVCQKAFNEALGKLLQSYQAALQAVYANHTVIDIDQSVNRKLNRESNKRKR